MKNIAIFASGILLGVFIMYLGGKRPSVGIDNSTNMAFSDAGAECNTTSALGASVLEHDKIQNTGDIQKLSESESFARNEDKQQDHHHPDRDQLSTLQEGDQSTNLPMGNDVLDVNDSEFREWTRIREREVEAIINDIAKDFSGREHMLEKIKSESEFLNPRVAEQDPYEDENWAYEKTQELMSIIYSQPGSSSLAISSITCKQLLCEVIGREKDGAWMPIMIQVMIHAKNIVRSHNNTEETFGVLYSGEEGDRYFYKVFKFITE